MAEADVRPQDVLALADFVAVYSFFFGPTALKHKSTHGAEDSRAASLSLSEIAIHTLQDERWRGTAEQVVFARDSMIKLILI